MQIWGLSEAEIRACATLARVAIHGDYQGKGITPAARSGGLNVRLSVDPDQPRDEAGLLPFQKRGYRGRRLSAVTWEGHREFMWFVFRARPEARIKSAIADYRGREDFREKHPQTRGLWGERPYFGF